MTHYCEICHKEIIRLQELREMIPLADYTKDLEDMLRRLIKWPNLGPSGGPLSLLQDEAKALLERTGYTNDF